ncbi:hypothetical protein THAOC_13915, partial [Thalassiosira oceanica]
MQSICTGYLHPLPLCPAPAWQDRIALLTRGGAALCMVTRHLRPLCPRKRERMPMPSGMSRTINRRAGQRNAKDGPKTSYNDDAHECLNPTRPARVTVAPLAWPPAPPLENRIE